MASYKLTIDCGMMPTAKSRETLSRARVYCVMKGEFKLSDAEWEESAETDERGSNRGGCSPAKGGDHLGCASKNRRAMRGSRCKIKEKILRVWTRTSDKRVTP